MALTSETQLGGRYRLDVRIALGGMGEVWRARDELLDRPVAVKVLRPEFVDDEDFVARFRAEARSAARLSHPNIATVFDYGEATTTEGGRTDTVAFLVMELVEGEPLSATLHREAPLPAARTMDMVAQAAAGLQAAHDAGVIHRDVKPGNLILRPDGVVKITDFGIARAADAVPITRTGIVMGTAHYLSPEQASGTTLTAAADVYSLGVVAYECLVGDRPFPGDNPVTVALAHREKPAPPLPGDVPGGVAALVTQMLAKDPAARPGSAGEVADRAAALARDPGSVGAGRTAVLGRDGAATTVLPGGGAGAGLAARGLAGAGLAGAAAAAGATAAEPHTREITGLGRPAAAPPRVLSPVPAPSDLPPPPAERLPRRSLEPSPPPARRRSDVPVGLLVVVGLLILGVGAAVVAYLVSRPTGTTAQPTASASPGATTGSLVAKDYVGRTVAQALSAIRDKGFTNATSGSTGNADQLVVTRVEPTGDNIPVTAAVRVYGAAPAPGPSTAAPPTPTRSPTPRPSRSSLSPSPSRSSAPPATTSPSPGPTIQGSPVSVPTNPQPTVSMSARSVARG